MPLTCPGDWLDADAINLALTQLPPRLEREYARKLELLEHGTILELALIGRLLQKSGSFVVTPWPDGTRVDLHLRARDRVLEMEIKAFIQTLYDKKVAEMCKFVAAEVEKRWPGFTGEINLFNDFREIQDGEVKTLDIPGTMSDVMNQLEKAITPEGEVRPEYTRFRPQRLITKIGPLSYLRVWHSSWMLPGGTEEDIIQRTVSRALDDRNQFSGEIPAILTIIQSRMPDARILYRASPSISDEAFARHPELSALVAVPCPSVNGHPVVLRPDTEDSPRRTHPISGEEAQALADFLAVRLQVDTMWDRLEQEFQERVRKGEIKLAPRS